MIVSLSGNSQLSPSWPVNSSVRPTKPLTQSLSPVPAGPFVQSPCSICWLVKNVVVTIPPTCPILKASSKPPTGSGIYMVSVPPYFGTSGDRNPSSCLSVSSSVFSSPPTVKQEEGFLSPDVPKTGIPL